MVFGDRELRARRTNAAFRRLAGRPDEAIIGSRPSDDPAFIDGALAERTLAEQVINKGIPVIDMHLEQTLPGQRRVLSWSAYRLTYKIAFTTWRGECTGGRPRPPGTRSGRQEAISRHRASDRSLG